LLKGRALQR